MGRHHRILVVGMVDSPHLARWLEHFISQPIEFLVFPSSPNRQLHVKLRSLINNTEAESQFSVVKWVTKFSLLLALVDLVVAGRLRTSLLRRSIKQFEPDLIHALELQHAGYLSHSALKRVGPVCPLFVTNWGSDLYWFKRKPRHAAKLVGLLQASDFYSAECERDVEMAMHMGFAGRVLPVLPNAGGIDLVATKKLCEETPTTSRDVILIKGYTNFVGRAQRLLRKLPMVSSELTGYEVVVYSATLHARLIAWYLRVTGKFENVKTIKKRALTHDEMLRLFARAKAYVGFSLSDGISTSMLEAMATGCVPLQTSTACINEWIQRGASIVSLDPSKPADALAKLVAVVNNQADLDVLVRQNRRVIEEYAGKQLVQSINQDVYSIILGECS